MIHMPKQISDVWNTKFFSNIWSLKQIYNVVSGVGFIVLIILGLILNYTKISDNVALLSMFGSLVQAVAAILMIIATIYLSIKQFHLIEKQNAIALIEKRINTRNDIDKIVIVMIDLLCDIKDINSNHDNHLRLLQMYDKRSKLNLNKEYITILFNKDQYVKINNILDKLDKCFTHGASMHATLISKYPITENEKEKENIINKYSGDCKILIEEINNYKNDFNEIYINCMQM